MLHVEVIRVHHKDDDFIEEIKRRHQTVREMLQVAKTKFKLKMNKNTTECKLEAII